MNNCENGTKCDTYCNTLDIAQTFFDFAGTSCENGTSLDKICKKQISESEEQEIYSNYYKYNGHSFEIRMIKKGRYKYSFIPQDIDELYDLQNDPYEMKNLSDDFYYQGIKEELRKKVFKHMEETDDYLLEILEKLPEAGTVGKPEYPKLKLDYSK